MFRNGILSKKRGVLLFIVALAVGTGTYSWALVFQIDVPPVLSLTEETGSFTLTFSDFLKGSRSSTFTTIYRIQTNNMVAGIVKGAVSGHLSEPFEPVELEAAVEGYQNSGENRFAHLVGSEPHFKAVGAQATPLADKETGQGSEDRCLDGRLTVTWRATLKENTPAGSQNRVLIVTLHDGY